jgi:hypothetical protein
VVIEQFLDPKALASKMRSILETWPLYRVFQYRGADQVLTLPVYIGLFCDTCRKETIWQRSSYDGENNRAGFTEKEYKCRNCGDSTTTYYFYWRKEKDNTEFFKVGQYPELEEVVSQELQDALTPEDLKLYKNALRLRNFNLGIAAVAYMRRVVENRMNDMLEILHEAARAHNLPGELLVRHEEIKKERRFSTKIEYAGDLLPQNIRPQGQPNPMAVLHELASEGLHTKTDEECVDIFDECRQTFEYVFGKMRIETAQANAFVKGIARLAEKRTKAGEANKK